MTNAKFFAGTIAGLFVIYSVLDMLIRIANEIGDVVSRGFFV